MNIKTLKKLSWWQKTRLTAFAFSLAGLLTVLAIGALLVASQSNSDIGRLAWISQTVLPLLTVVVVGVFTKIQRSIDLRNSGDAPSADIAAAKERRT